MLEQTYLTQLGAASHGGSVRASQPAAQGSIPRVPESFSKSLGFIDRAA